MKQILVVFTGGTIGSTATGGTIDTSSNAPYKLLQLFEQQYPNHAELRFETLHPLQMLSENLAPAAWKIVIDAIESAQPSIYDGIIVTHGTDTLAYSATALSLYFHALELPMLLVSSDYPLENPKGNGLANFICAVEFIRQGIAKGVFVPYRNAGQMMQVHRGSRLTCSLQLSGDFYSVQGRSYLQFDGQNFSPAGLQAIDSAKPDLKKSDFKESTETGSANSINLKPQFSNKILMIKPYTGLDYSHFNLEGVMAVLHDLYHSGTACVTGEWGKNLSLIDFLKRCQGLEIPVYLAPVCQSENAYQSTRQLIEHGADLLWNMSIEAAYVKLSIAYGNFSDKQQIADFLQQDIAFEHI